MLSRSSSPSTHVPFLPRVSDADIMWMKSAVAQELHIHDDNMLTSDLFYYSSYTKSVWKKKQEAIKNGEVYIGG
jgi:hypothetical protein